MLSTTWPPPAITAFYRGMRDKDVGALMSSLDPQVVVSASAGMPLGVGGIHSGAPNALRELWGVVNAAYDIAPIPDSISAMPDGRVVVHGWYRGSIRRTGQAVEAEFVHLIRLTDDAIGELRQITDTATWGEP